MVPAIWAYLIAGPAGTVLVAFAAEVFMILVVGLDETLVPMIELVASATPDAASAANVEGSRGEEKTLDQSF